MAPLPALAPPPLDAPPLPVGFAAESPFTGDGLSSLDLSLSGRGGRNAVGEVDGVLVELAFDDVDDEDDDVDEDAVLLVVVFVVAADPAVVTARPPRPLEPPLRSLE